jgi:hypothetical protein
MGVSYGGDAYKSNQSTVQGNTKRVLPYEMQAPRAAEKPTLLFGSLLSPPWELFF